MKKYICVLKCSALHHVPTKLESGLLKNFQWKSYTANSYKNVYSNLGANTMSQIGTGIFQQCLRKFSVLYKFFLKHMSSCLR